MMAERRATLSALGLAPRYLSREEAAAYLGVSPDVFDDEVRRGIWPPPRRRGAAGRRLTWDRVALDAVADRSLPGLLSGLTEAAGDPDAAALEARLDQIARTEGRPKAPRKR